MTPPMPSTTQYNSRAYQSFASLSRFEDSDLTPFVRFASNGGKSRQPVLRPVKSPIGDGVNTVGPVYLLTDNQAERQANLQNPYQVRGEASTIATELQNECEASGRVLYPLFAESDDLGDENAAIDVFETVKEWVELLGFDPSACRWYHSGGRSIHAHLPAFTTGEYLPELRELASDFNEGRSITVDSMVYSLKRQFRLPGTIHETTGLPKVGIDADSDDPIPSPKRQVEAFRSSEGKPETFADYWGSLPKVEWVPDSPTIPTHPTLNSARVYSTESVPLESGTSVSSTDKSLINPYLKDSEAHIPLLSACNEGDDPLPSEVQKRYERACYSPYANADGTSRSVAIFRVKGDPFRRSESGYSYLPTYIHAAVSCDSVFTVFAQPSPVKLSHTDRAKRQWSDGDLVVLIGGKSRSSRIFDLSYTQAQILSGVLTCNGWWQEDFDPAGGKDKALETLSDDSFGFDVGSSGPSIEYPERTPKPSHKPTDAAVLQRSYENDSHRPIDRNELFRVGCRLLQTEGWKGAVEWFSDALGDRFDPVVTHKGLQGAVEGKPEWYDVTVPETPYDPLLVTESNI